MISILLASFNGEKYIADQIDSLLCQTFQDFKLYICDDCSTDGTYHIATEYEKKHPERIYASQNKENTGGAKHNFLQMMIEHKDDYVMLCDQDDVWIPDKIEITLVKMKETEHEFGTDTPILVHTDLRVVSEKLEPISPSFKAAMNANYGKTKLRNQIIQNTLTGCTAMYNRALADLITDTPKFMVMHDWWLILTASAFGQIASIDEQTVLYRQHGDNEIGAKDVRTLKYKIYKLRGYGDIKKALNDTYIQAHSFLGVFREKLTEEQNVLLRMYCDIPNHSKFIRVIKLFNLGVFKNGFARKMAHFIYI